MQRTYESSKTVGKEGNGSAVKNGVAARQVSLEDLHRDYGKRAFQFAYRLSGNTEEAKECVQEAFFRVVKNWDRYDASRSLDAWFFTILRHVFLDGRRRYERRMGVSLNASVSSEEGESGTFADLLPAEEESIPRSLERKEVAGTVQRVLSDLSPNHRAVLRLRDIGGLNYDEIAQTLGISAGTIRSRISRAREAFRNRSAQLAVLAS